MKIEYMDFEDLIFLGRVRLLLNIPSFVQIALTWKENSEVLYEELPYHPLPRAFVDYPTPF